MLLINKVLQSSFPRLAQVILTSMAFSLLIISPASAHLMVAQNGTINIVGDGAFLVLSLPISAFENVDDDGDKLLSRAEFTKHRSTLMATVNKKVRLVENSYPRPLQGMMLSPVAHHKNPMAPTDQIIVMGRFLLATNSSDLTFHLELFGTKDEEKQQKMTFTFNKESLRNIVSLNAKKTKTSLFSKEESNK